MTGKLYCFGESGNSYKAALTLTLCEIDWSPVFVDFFNGEARSDAYRAINVMGEVPVYVDGDLKLTQSGVIQTYATDQSGKLGGNTTEERYEVLRWLLWDNSKMSGYAGAARFQGNFLPEKYRKPDVLAFLGGRVKAGLEVLEAALDGRDWLVGDRITIADTACCGYLYYPEPFGFTRADWPNIDRWLAQISSQSGWKHPYDMMPGSPKDRA